MSCGLTYKDKFYTQPEFKDYVQGNMEEFFPKLDSPIEAHAAPDDLGNFVDYLSTKFAVKAEVVNEVNSKWAAKIEGGRVIINKAYADYSDVWHEFSHPLLISMRTSNKGLFNDIYESLKGTKEWELIAAKAEDKVRKLYPEYNEHSEDYAKLDNYREEVLATALGYAAGARTTATAKFLNIINKIIDWISKLFNLDAATSLYIKEINPQMSFSDFLSLMQHEDFKIRPEPNWHLFDPESKGEPGSLKRIIYEHNNLVRVNLTPFLANRYTVPMSSYKPRVKTPGLEASFEPGADPSLVEVAGDVLRTTKPDVYTQINIGVADYLTKLRPRDFNQEVDHVMNSLNTSVQGSGIITPATQGNPVDISSDYIRQLQANPTGKTELGKPFSSSTASAKENEVLKEFYDDYSKEIEAFFKGKPPKSIDNKRLLNKYIKWLSEKYPVYWYLTTPQTMTYGLDEAINRNEMKPMGKGYEVLIANKYLYQTGHTYTIVDEEGKSLFGPQYNATGWYIYHELFKEIPLVYEFQSDVIDDVDALKSRLGVTTPDYLVESATFSVNHFVDSMRQFLTNVEEGEHKDAYFVKSVIGDRKGNLEFKIPKAVASFSSNPGAEIDTRINQAQDAAELFNQEAVKNFSMASYISNTNLKQRIGYLSKLAAEGRDFYDLINEDVLKIEEVNFVLKGIKIKANRAGTFAITEEITGAPPTNQVWYIVNLLKAIDKDKATILANVKANAIGAINASKESQRAIYYLEQIKETGVEKFNEARRRYLKLAGDRIEATVQLLAARSIQDFRANHPELIKHEDIDKAEVKLREQLEKYGASVQDIVSGAAEFDAIKQLNSMKAVQLRFFIEHSFNYAKSKGHNKVYLPTAQFIDEVESGDPWTLYVSPYDQKVSKKYKDSHIGSFYEALLEVPGIEIKYTDVKGITKPLLEVDISNFNKGVERFSKTFDSPLSAAAVENDLKALYKPITLFNLADGTPVLDSNMLPGRGSKIAEAIKAKYGWQTLRGVVYFDRKQSTAGRTNYTTLRIDKEALAKRLEPEQLKFFDSTLEAMTDAMRDAAETQAKFEVRLARIGEEADKISRIISKIDNEAVRTRLRDAVRLVQDPIKQTDVKNFSYLVFEASETLKHFAGVLKDLSKLPLGEQLGTVDRAKTLADNFEDLIVYLNKEFRFINDTNEFKAVINDFSKYFDQIQTIYSAEVQQLAIQKLGEILEPDKKIAFDKLTTQLKTLEEQKSKAVNAGTSEKFVARLDQKIKDIKKDMIKFVPDETMIGETFEGLRGDLNWLTANFRSTLAMGDPIISGFSRQLKEGYNAVRHALVPIRNLVYDQLSNYKRVLNKSNNQTMASFYEGLYDLQETSRIDFEGNIQKTPVYTLLAPFKESFYTEDLEYRNKIKKLKKAREDSKEIEKEYNDWLSKYAQRKYKDAWYERHDLLHPEAAKAREAILTEMNNKLRGPNRDAITDTDLERLHELKYELKRMASDYKPDGTLKNEDDRKIAESVRAFNKATSEMSTWEITEENRNWFNIILQKKKDQLSQGLISQEDFDKWYRLNTQRVISPEFYKKRDVITKTISNLMAKLPREKFSEDISKLWGEVFDVARPYRDEDNVLDGSEVKPEERTVVKTDEEKIEEIKRKLIRFSGLNLKEEQELQALWNSIESLSAEEIRKFSELRDKKMAYKAYIGAYLSEGEFKLLMDSFTQLSAIQNWATTEYYKKVYNEELHKYRMEVDPEFEENIEEIQEEFEMKSDWYKANHVTHFKKVFDEGHGYYTEVSEPLYVWKDIIPTDPKFIEQNAPGFAFRTRIIKDGFLNPEHSLDVKERMLPKKYSSDGQLSPYTNEKYEALKNNSINDSQAKAKWDMLKLLTDIHLESQRELPLFKRLGYVLPGLLKEGYDRRLEGGVKGTIRQAKLAFSKTQDEKDLTLGDVSQLDLSIIPLKFSTPVKPEDQNLNLAEAILKHKAAAEEYKYLETELPLAKAISHTLKTAKEDVPQSKINNVLSWMGLKKYIKSDKQSNRSNSFDEFMRTMFYGETETPFPNIIEGVDTNKIMNNFLGLSSIQIMVLNIPAHITNIVSGEIQNVIEASAKKYFTWKDYLRAKAIYAANVPNFWSDYTHEGNQSYWNALAQYFDVPQGEFLDHFGRKTNFTRIRHLRSQLMFIKFGGEHEIQVSTLMAMMQNYKVDVDGKSVPLNEALYQEDSKIKIKAGAKINGKELTEKDLSRFQDKVHSVLRALNGAYSRFDKTAAEKSFLGKLAFYMRKYFIPMAFRRFETFKYDYEEQDFKEGYYLTGWHMIKDLVHLRADLVRNWGTYKNTLSPEEATNARRLFTELGIITMLAMTIWLIGGYDNDRKMKGRWFYTMALYHLMRAKSEAETFIPAPGLGLNEFTTLFSSPFAAASTVKTIGRGFADLSNTILMDQDAKFKRDYGIWKEGDLRLWSDIIKLTGVNVNLATPENLVKNFELRQR